MKWAVLDAEKVYPWIVPAVLFALFAFAGLFLKRIVFRYLRSLSSDKRAMSLFLEAIDRMFGLWLILAGTSAAAAAAPISPHNEHIVHVLVRLGFLLSGTLTFVRFIASLAANGLWFTSNRAIAHVLSNFGRLAITTLGALLVLSNFGISITPLLTALGVGSLAVALALQDTLGNFFAGMNLVMSRTIEPGQHIKLDSGYEGTVLHIAWRVTTLQDMSDNIILVPNTKLAQAIVTRIDKPAKLRPVESREFQV